MADESFLQPDADTPVPIQNAQEQMPGLAGYIKSKFEDAENGRRSHELKWLQSYKNFKGIYESTTQYRDSERKKVFIKITKTKVLAAYGQIVDILFSNKKFPLVVEPNVSLSDDWYKKLLKRETKLFERTKFTLLESIILKFILNNTVKKKTFNYE